MTSSVAARRAVRGQQEPSFSHVPDYTSSAGGEAVELCRMAGLGLDPWQELVLEDALGERADGTWAAFEVGLEVSRQNGKGTILEARELSGLFLLGERLIIHSAHEFATSLEAFRRLLYLIEDTPEFDRRVKRVSRAHGEEGIELKGGQRIRFRTRTKGGGRGFSGDCLILDEAMILPEAMHGALLPTLSARPNPQVWYVGSAVDQEIHDHGSVFARVRDRGLRGDDPALAYFEWSVGVDVDEVTEEMARDPAAWARANPTLGRRITHEYVAREQKSMDPRTFAVERLGAGDWPDLEATAEQDLSLEAWMACTDKSSKAVDPVTLAFDVTPDRAHGAIGSASRRADRKVHLEIIEHDAGTSWIPQTLADLVAAHGVAVVKCDEKSPAAALLPAIAALGVKVEMVNGSEYAQGCGAFVDDVNDGVVQHLGTDELRAAVRGVRKRPLGDAWAWSRKSSSVDISPLVAVTLARWGLSTAKKKTKPRFRRTL